MPTVKWNYEYDGTLRIANVICFFNVWNAMVAVNACFFSQYMYKSRKITSI